ncbi:MAG: S1C family serine protease [bacterium]
MKEFLKKRKFVFLSALIFILSMFGGAMGGEMARLYCPGSFCDFFSSSNLDFSNGKFMDQGIVISNAKNVIVQQDAKIEETINSVGASLVGIYKKSKLAKQSDVFSLDNFYGISGAEGQGFIITSDGWIATSLDLDKNYADYVVISKDKKIYQIDKAASDSGTSFNFIHVAAKDFPVRKFAEKNDVKPGNLTVSVNWQGLSWVSSVLGYKEKGGLVKSSDDFSSALVLNGAISAEFIGSMIFNLSGDALGMVGEKGEIEPMSHLQSAANSLFKIKAIKRPSLGVNYIDLSKFIAAEEKNNYFQKGAVIYKDQKIPAVKKNSPADKAGLKEGDVIISIDDIYLDKINDLAEITQSRAVGDKINLIVARSGVERKVEIILEEKK